MTSSDTGPLLGAFDALVCDLDGVVYRGQEAIPGAVEALRDAGRRGTAIAYATNNASRPPTEVAEQLRGFGLDVADTQVVTSAQAGAHAMRDRLGAGAVVLAVGGPGVRLALQQAGLTAVVGSDRDGGQIQGVLQGFGRDVRWADLAEAAYAVAQGAHWVATNTDATLPTERGTAPGNGTLVAAVGRAAGAEPVVVGKPQAPLYDLAIEVLAAPPERTLAVGDRIDTDIAGAHAAGLTALLVLTGVDRAVQLAGLPAGERPRFVVADLSELHRSYADPAADDGTWSCGSARVRLDGGAAPELTVLAPGTHGERVRATLAALWSGIDDGALSAEQARRIARTLESEGHEDRAARRGGR